jgi:hypothetical protein
MANQAVEARAEDLREREALVAALLFLHLPTAQPEPGREERESDRMQKELAEVKE